MVSIREEKRRRNREGKWRRKIYPTLQVKVTHNPCELLRKMKGGVNEVRARVVLCLCCIA
jgi:hypothetical protein